MTVPRDIPIERRAVNLKWWAVFASLVISVVTLMTTIGALVWGAATISSSVNQLGAAVTNVTTAAEKLRMDMNDVQRDVTAIKTTVDFLKDERNRP